MRIPASRTRIPVNRDRTSGVSGTVTSGWHDLGLLKSPGDRSGNHADREVGGDGEASHTVQDCTL